MSASVPLDQIELGSAPTHPDRTALSFEVIPPRHDADEAKVDHLLRTLQGYGPDYIAVTSSQRSGWLDGTARFIQRIDQTTTMRPLAHLACTAGTRAELVGWINTLVDSGVRGLLALRGDLPEGETSLPAGYVQHADQLVKLIRELESDQAARFAAGRLAVGVACYPNGHAESANADEDIDVLLAKQRIGADLAISQLFFDAEDYLRFATKAELAGVKIPLIPGIMPITSLARAQRMGQLSGLAVPDRVLAKLEAAPPEKQHEVGMELTVDLARTVIAGGAKSLHIYTHNNAEITTELLSRIGIESKEPHNV